MTAVWLVAAREIRQKLRSRAFWVVNAVLLLAVLLTILVPLLVGSGTSATPVGVVGADARAVVELAADPGETGFGPSLEVVELPDEATARTAVLDGEVDAALVAPDRLLADGDVTDLEGRLAGAARVVGVQRALIDAGVAPDEVGAVLTPVPLAVEQVGSDPAVDFGPQFAIGFAAIAVLYGLLVFYGQLVAQGVVQEKQTRVVEVLVATIRPVELLAGKLVGLGLVGLSQVVALVGLGSVGIVVSDVIEVPSDVIGTLVLVAGWYVLGYLLYATLFALTGALVSRTEDLQSAVMPVVMLLVGALLAVQFSITDPSGTVATVASLVPFSAPLAQPLRVAAGVGSLWSGLLAAALTLATVAVLLPLAARVYRGGVLVTRGRIGFRSALRSGAGRPD